MDRFRFRFAVFTILLGVASVDAQEPRMRMVLGTSVVCREAPSRDAAIRYVYVIGDRINATVEEQTNGETWYFDRNRVTGRFPTCWVYGPLTVEFMESNPAVALAAAADHALGRKDASFEDLVAVENLLLQGLPGRPELLASAGLLQYKRLRLIQQITSDPDASGRSIARAPLKKAWFLSHADLVQFFEPAGSYFIPVEAYWTLHDRFPREPWAEELAWAAAQLWVPSDECYSDCVLGAIERTAMQYWTRYPGGRFVNEAIEKAIPRIAYASQMSLYDTPPNALFARLRASLTGVSAPAKARFLEMLEEAERRHSGSR